MSDLIDRQPEIPKRTAETEHFVPNDELISRKAANEWCYDCKEYDNDRHCCPRWNRVIRNTVEELKAEHMPSVQVRKGRWIKDRLCSINGGTYGVRRCSICEAYYQDIGYGWNYCPNCGCAMTEGAEDETD